MIKHLSHTHQIRSRHVYVAALLAVIAIAGSCGDNQSSAGDPGISGRTAGDKAALFSVSGAIPASPRSAGHDSHHGRSRINSRRQGCDHSPALNLLSTSSVRLPHPDASR